MPGPAIAGPITAKGLGSLWKLVLPLFLLYEAEKIVITPAMRKMGIKSKEEAMAHLQAQLAGAEAKTTREAETKLREEEKQQRLMKALLAVQEKAYGEKAGIEREKVAVRAAVPQVTQGTAVGAAGAPMSAQALLGFEA